MDTNINIRKIELKDYEYIDKWWVEQGFIALDKSILPMNGLGGIIIEKNKPIAVGYLYLTNSKMGYIDNLIADLNYKSKDRFDIIIKLIQACKQVAKELGIVDIWAITKSKGILKRCESLGYNITDNNHAIISI